MRDTKSAPFTRLRGIHDRRGRLYTTGRTSATGKKKMRSRSRSCHEEEATTIMLRKKTISARGRSPVIQTLAQSRLPTHFRKFRRNVQNAEWNKLERPVPVSVVAEHIGKSAKSWNCERPVSEDRSLPA
ncbi:hypothetical protein ACMD2_24976 [Ananas comosus]|uniref:Uncharacterized protein n=1 Tax=Ananas comosus TaxID=4615 RepID=A0A199VXW0_ANACO|nr:hypothetical protein ACMD2_24976 [Ananas comosus]